MKKFFVVLQFELLNYIKNKSFMLTTIIISVIALAVMFAPRVFDMSGILGTDTKTEQSGNNDKADKEDGDNTDADVILIYDKSGTFADITLLSETFKDCKVEKASSEDDIRSKIENEEASYGFVVENLAKYKYYVLNQSMYDSYDVQFRQLMLVANQMVYCQANDINYEEIMQAFNPVIDSEKNILGKDMMSNYWYCYALVIVIFMIIILYGTMVATSVTQEKSNRTIEVLVTSADTTTLFFAKVIAGTIAALIQAGIMFAAVIGGYRLNQAEWGGMFDMIFDIPSDVIVTFAFFGLGGLLFYTFLYGAMGALVSKTEDINKSSGSLQMIIMIVYFVVLFSLSYVDGILIKVASFLPISSYSAMFARVAMGSVAMWEVVVSFLILVVSIIGVGILGSKIYRMGTLRYGNPIKLSNAFKFLKEEK